MAKSHLKLVTPATVIRTVMPRRLPNGELRTREYLTKVEVERLLAAAKTNRYGHRDATMALVAFRHGLRASELVDLRWDQVDFATATMHVRRIKQGTPEHPPNRLETNCGCCGGYSVNRNPKRPSCLPQSVVPHSPRPALPAWSSGQALRQDWASRHTRTCSGTPAATPWPTKGTTRAPCKPTWGTAISSIRFGTQNWHPTASSVSGKTEGTSAC